MMNNRQLVMLIRIGMRLPTDARMQAKAAKANAPEGKVIDARRFMVSTSPKLAHAYAERVHAHFHKNLPSWLSAPLVGDDTNGFADLQFYSCSSGLDIDMKVRAGRMVGPTGAIALACQAALIARDRLREVIRSSPPEWVGPIVAIAPRGSADIGTAASRRSAEFHCIPQNAADASFF